MKWWGWGDERRRVHATRTSPGSRRSSEAPRRRRRATRRSGRSPSTTSTSPSRACPTTCAPRSRRRPATSRPSPRPRGPRARQEPARPRAPPPRRPRPRCPTSSSGPAARTTSTRSCGRRWTPTPSSSPSAAAPTSPAASRPPGGRAAARRLGRHAPAGPRCSTIDEASRPGAGAGGRVRPAPRGAAQRPGVDARPLPRQLHALDARRLDRHPLLGDAVRQVRRHRRHHARGARGDARRHARHPAGAEHVDRARACARWCSAARAASGSSPRRPCTCTACPERRKILGYLFPDWPTRAGRDARDRRERGVAVGHARVRRPRDAFSFATRRRRRCSTALKSRR